MVWLSILTAIGIFVYVILERYVGKWRMFAVIMGIGMLGFYKMSVFLSTASSLLLSLFLVMRLVDKLSPSKVHKTPI